VTAKRLLDGIRAHQESGTTGPAPKVPGQPD
jgi:hypothetical protein